MLISVLKSKIAYVTVTQKDLFYVDSMSRNEEVMQQANLIENKQVQVVNLNNGECLETYVIKAKAGSKIFGLNGDRLPEKPKRVTGYLFSLMPEFHLMKALILSLSTWRICCEWGHRSVHLIDDGSDWRLAKQQGELHEQHRIIRTTQDQHDNDTFIIPLPVDR